MSDKEEVNITVTTNQLSSSKVSQYQRGLNRFIKIYRKLELSVTFDSIWKLQKKKSISTQKLKSANMNRNMFNYILKRKQLQLSELRSKSPFRGGNKSRYGDELHSRAGKRAYMKSRGKSRKFRKWGKGDKQGQSEGWGQGEAGGRFRNKSANNGGNGGTNDQQGRSMTGGGGMYRNKSSKIQNRREDGGGMNNISGEGNGGGMNNISGERSGREQGRNGGGMNNISGEGRSERKFNNSGQNEGAGNYGNNNMNSNNKGGQYNNVNQNNKGGQNNNDNNQNLNQDQQNKNLNLGERYSDYPQNNENGFYYDKNGNKQIGNQYNSEGQQNFGNGKNRFKKNKGDDNFNQGTGYDNFRNNINKLNNRDNNENNNDYISFTKNESEYYRKEPLSHWIWEKRKKELQRKFPNLNNDEILKMLKREFGLKLLRNVFHNKNQKNKSHIFNRLTRFLGKNKRDKITFMYLESVLRNMKNKNLRSLFSKFRTKNSKTKTNKTIKIEKKVVRTISKKIKETQPDKYIILLLDSIRKDKLRKAFQNIRLTSLFKKLKSQPGGMYTIEHIQEVKRGILDGQDLNYKLMAVILDKIMAFNQRRHKHLAINEMKDLDLDSTKVLYPRVSKIKNNKSISGKHHPMFKTDHKNNSNQQKIMRNSHGQRNSKKVNWENMGGQDPNMTNGTTFHLGKDGQIRNSQGQVIDLRDSRDFGKTKPNNHGKRTHISNQQMLNNFKDSRKKRKSKGDNLPLKKRQIKLRANEIALIKKNPSFFNQKASKSTRSYSRRDKSAALRNFNAEIDRLSHFGHSKSKTKSMTPNLIPRSIHNPMKHSGHFSTHLSQQTDQGHYLHNKNFFGRSNIPDQQSWISNSNINKRFRPKKDSLRFPRISESNYDDPSLYRYGQYQGGSFVPNNRRNNQFSAKFSDGNSLAESNQGIRPKDASNLNAKRKVSPIQNSSKIRYTLQNGTRPRQSELREIEEKLSNDNEKNNGDKNNNQISRNNGEIDGSNYFVDSKTGKKYFKRNSTQSNQNIYYIDKITGKKVIIQNTSNMGNHQNNIQNSSNIGNHQNTNISQNLDNRSQNSFYINQKTGQKMIQQELTANSYYIDIKTKKKVWIYLYRISDQKAYFVHPQTKANINVQFAKTAKDKAFFQDPTTNKHLTLQIISNPKISGNQVSNGIRTQQNQDTISQRSGVSSNSQTRKIIRKSGNQGNGSTYYYIIDPKTGKRVLQKSNHEVYNQTNSGNQNKARLSYNLRSQKDRFKNMKNSSTNKKTISYSPVPKNSNHTSTRSQFLTNQQINNNNNTNGKYRHQKFLTNQVQFKNSQYNYQNNQNLNTMKKDSNQNNSHYNQSNFQNSYHNNQNGFQNTFKNFESFNQHKSHPKQIPASIENSTHTDIIISNQYNLKNNQKNFAFSGNNSQSKNSRGSPYIQSNVNTRKNNHIISPNRQFDNKNNSNLSTKYNNPLSKISYGDSVHNSSKRIKQNDQRLKINNDQSSQRSFCIETSSKLRKNLTEQDMDNYKLKRYGKRVHN